ncbi:MAG TPA: AsmA family protein, partial [Sphingomonadales bacterium]|nr:AsmA family protein [Sphingomonadales bacterium]
MKGIRKKLIIAGGVLLAVLAFLLIAPNFVDWNRFKPEVERGFEAATGRQIAIAGELSFKLLPAPALSVSRVSLANVPWARDANFLELESLDIRMRLLPLLNKDVEVTSLVLVGGRINLERAGDGRANWSELFEGAEEQEKPSDQKVAFESFILKRTDVALYDHASDETTAFAGIDAEFTVASMQGPLQGEGEFTFNGVPLDFTADVGETGE